MSWTVRTSARASTLLYGIARSVGELSAGGVWLLPANVCPAVPLAFTAARVSFEFIDIHPETLALDADQAAVRMTAGRQPPVVGIVYVRSYGANTFAEADIARLRCAGRGGEIIVDDRCLCVPETELDGPASHEADAVIFSTGYGKVLDLGGGGYGFFRPGMQFRMPSERGSTGAFDALMTQYKAAIARRHKLFEGSAPAEDSPVWYWLPGEPGPDWANMQRLIQNRLPEALAHKERLNWRYDLGLQGLNCLPDAYQSWRYNLRVPERDRLLQRIMDVGLFASDHYYPASNLFGDVMCPHATHLHGDVLNLFNDFHFTEAQADRVVEIIQGHCRNSG